MILFPNAKINLGLNIVARRKDGYHDIVSCLYPIVWQDVLEVIEGGGRKTELKITGLNIEGPGGSGTEKDNLALRAYELLRKDYNLPPVNVHLHKIIPTGAGLGGGSADAAFMLKAINEMFQLFLDDFILEDYAGQLGSDCPFFIQNKPTIVLERGDVFEEVTMNLHGHHLLVVKPPVHVSTAEAYAGITPRTPDQSIKEVLENSPIDARCLGSRLSERRLGSSRKRDQPVLWGRRVRHNRRRAPSSQGEVRGQRHGQCQWTDERGSVRRPWYRHRRGLG